MTLCDEAQLSSAKYEQYWILVQAMTNKMAWLRMEGFVSQDIPVDSHAGTNQNCRM